MILAVLELCAVAFIVTFCITQVLLPLLYRAPVCPWFRTRSRNDHDSFTTRHNGGRYHDDNP